MKLDDLGLGLSDFIDQPLDYVYLGVAVSNPSSISTDTFANGHYVEAKGSDAEYDTLRLGTVVPLPPAVWLFGFGLLGVLGCSARKRRTG